MKLDPTKKVRQVADEHLVIMQDGQVADLTTVLALNGTSYWLYRQLAGREFDVDEVARLLVGRFEVDEATARRDAQEWTDRLREHGMLLEPNSAEG